MRSYQLEINHSTLYETRFNGIGREQLRPMLECAGGTVTVYGSQEPPASAPSGMSVINGMENITLADFKYVPNYIYIEVASGSPELIISGISFDEYTELFPLFTELGGFLQSEDGEFIYA